MVIGHGCLDVSSDDFLCVVRGKYIFHRGTAQTERVRHCTVIFLKFCKTITSYRDANIFRRDI